MATPTSYTEDDLAAYMLGELGDVGADLTLSAAASATKGDLGDFTEPVNDVLLDYGRQDVTAITGEANIAKLRALGKVHAWRLARKRAAARYNFSDGTQRLERAAVFSMIDKELAAAEGIAAELGATASGRLVVKVGTMRYAQDPYAPQFDDRASS